MIPAHAKGFCCLLTPKSALFVDISFCHVSETESERLRDVQSLLLSKTRLTSAFPRLTSLPVRRTLPPWFHSQLQLFRNQKKFHHDNGIVWIKLTPTSKDKIYASNRHKYKRCWYSCQIVKNRQMKWRSMAATCFKFVVVIVSVKFWYFWKVFFQVILWSILSYVKL